MVVYARLFHHLGVGAILILFRRLAASGADPCHHRELSGAGVLDSDCGDGVSGDNEVVANTRNGISAVRDCCNTDSQSNPARAFPTGRADRISFSYRGLPEYSKVRVGQLAVH